MFLGFQISEQQHEQWYGEQKIAIEMKHDQLIRKWHFGLKFLDLRGCNLGS